MSAKLKHAATKGVKTGTVVERIDAIYKRGTDPMNDFDSLASYAPIKARVAVAVRQVADILVGLVPTYPLEQFHEDDLARLLSGFAGSLSGMIAQLEMSEEDQKVLVQISQEAAKKAFVQMMMEEMLHDRVVSHSDGIPVTFPGDGKQDLN